MLHLDNSNIIAVWCNLIYLLERASRWIWHAFDQEKGYPFLYLNLCALVYRWLGKLFSLFPEICIGRKPFSCELTAVGFLLLFISKKSMLICCFFIVKTWYDSPKAITNFITIAWLGFRMCIDWIKPLEPLVLGEISFDVWGHCRSLE